jgi:hypothetical protein
VARTAEQEFLESGHADNFAVGLLCEMAGYWVPAIVVPHCKPQLASYPAWRSDR